MEPNLAYNNPPTHTNVRTVNPLAGEVRSELAEQWTRRPEDERYTSLESLLEAAEWQREHSREIRTVISGGTSKFSWRRNSNELILRLGLKAGQGADEFTMTNYVFNKICAQLEAPAPFLARLPAELAAANLNHQLQHVGIERQLLVTDKRLYALTGPNYGRVWDAEIVSAVIEMNKHSGGIWKVPGTMSVFGQYDPDTPVTIESTTLFRSAHDLWIFLCADQHPIEVGKLDNGEPDLMFPGFYLANSQTGHCRITLGAMWLRAVCQNRNLWGVEGFRELTFRHTKFAPDRFESEYRPMLIEAMNVETSGVVARVQEAKRQLFADNVDGVVPALVKRGLSKGMAEDIFLEGTEGEDGVWSVWATSQAISQHARQIGFTDERIKIEKIAGNLMEEITV